VKFSTLSGSRTNTRSGTQPYGNVIGQRSALVRDPLLGLKLSDLIAGLPSASRNVISQRLRERAPGPIGGDREDASICRVHERAVFSMQVTGADRKHRAGGGFGQGHCEACRLSTPSGPSGGCKAR
jgi:hypothetical protein